MRVPVSAPSLARLTLRVGPKTPGSWSLGALTGPAPPSIRLGGSAVGISFDAGGASGPFSLVVVTPSRFPSAACLVEASDALRNEADAGLSSADGAACSAAIFCFSATSAAPCCPPGCAPPGAKVARHTEKRNN